LSSEGDVKMFVTIFCGILDTASGEVLYANAGHNPPLIRKKSGEVTVLKTSRGLVLGAFEGIEYRLEKTQLEPGEVLFMYTDGVTEAMNIKEDFFTMERLEKNLSLTEGNNVRGLIEAVMAGLVTFTEGAPQSDDITMMAIQYKRKSSLED
jgi:sigma-B regulation protein RsbU (phosphoserine phosphatase)